MKILLTTISAKYIHQNLAIRILYELNKNYPTLDVQEFNPKDSNSEIIDFCSKYHVVAFSCYIWNIEQTLEIAIGIKEQNPRCKILLGGPEVSYEWHDIIALLQIDYIIYGEGEIPFSKFLKLYPAVDQVPGLVWKKAGQVIKNQAPETFDLPELNDVNPYVSVPHEDLRLKINYIETSRGCPHCCDFCLAGLDNKLRFLPLETIQSNLLYLMEHGKVIKFLDRTFNAKPAFAISIFRFILDHYKPGNIFQFEIKADILQKELIAFVREHVPKGIFRFEIGIQTLNAVSNQEVKRRQHFENIKTFISQIADKVELHLDLIVGLPYDYLENIKYSFNEVFKLFAPELQLGFLKFLKGTPIRNHYIKHGYKFQTTPPYQILESKYLSQAEIAEIAMVENMLGIYWNKQRAIYTLKYAAIKYSAYDFLLGLGKYRNGKNALPVNGLTELYTTLHNYAKRYFPDDGILAEFIALDYYMHHKVKPAIRFLPELSRHDQNEIISRLKLNIHKYRYVIHPVHFSVEKLVKYSIIEPCSDLLIIKFTGRELPELQLVE